MASRLTGHIYVITYFENVYLFRIKLPRVSRITVVSRYSVLCICVYDINCRIHVDERRMEVDGGMRMKYQTFTIERYKRKTRKRVYDSTVKL